MVDFHKLLRMNSIKKSNPHIAIIGAGLAGLSVAWHLLRSERINITIFDSKGIGGGSSGIAAGLLHPYGGPRARLNVLGREGIAAALELFQEADRYLSEPSARQTKLYRIPRSAEQAEDFITSSKQFADMEYAKWKQYPALCIDPAWIIDTPAYLSGLWQACKNYGAQLVIKKVDNMDMLHAFDIVVIAAGADSIYFKECEHLSIGTLKGQILEVSWPQNASFPSTPLTVDSYLVPNQEQRKCLIGATFERNYTDTAPHLEEAASLLLPSFLPYFPHLAEPEIISCRSGLRATTPGHMPLCKRLNEKTWVATALGSKGLLYHGLLGRETARQILS